MRKIFLCIIFAILSVFFILSCEKDDTKIESNMVEKEVESEVEPEVKPEVEPEVLHPVISNKLTWDKINAFPIKSGDMSIEEMRQLCVDFFRFTKTALWTPDEDLTFATNRSGGKDKLEKGKVYGGLPYVNLGSGNVYRLMDYYDEKSGIVDISEACKNPTLFGNQCSISAYWAWGRVINSANYKWTAGMVEANGFIHVGPYSYDLSIKSWSEATNTTDIVKENGDQTMYQSYAQLHIADGLVYYTTAGHVIMCASEPVVVYKDDGTINPNRSYITIIDQGNNWLDKTNESQDSFSMKESVDKRMYFYQLYRGSYLPFTFSEFLGSDPVEETRCIFTHKNKTITPDDLKHARISANYGLSDAYLKVLNSSEEVVFSCASRAQEANQRYLNFSNAFSTKKFSLFTSGDYTVEIVCQLSTGERLTLYSGKLVAE